MKFINGMADISIKSVQLTPFGGIFSIIEQFDSKLREKLEKGWNLELTIHNSQFRIDNSQLTMDNSKFKIQN